MMPLADRCQLPPFCQPPPLRRRSACPIRVGDRVQARDAAGGPHIPASPHKDLFLPSYKDPSFQDRAAAAARAKQKAIEQLKARPKPDPAVLEEKRLAREAKEKAIADERAAKAAAVAAAKAEAAAKLAAEKAEADAAAAERASRARPATPAEMKAARDARYAARKARQ